ncbi:MAG: double-strand break repair protein AddB [Alphaproteobacteria bacterium]|jgi:ATP-dependent helicase/nuclease subunit B|nr:double-strand break repair protein AddB [Alphaproteobacteria bacterium]
MIYNIPFERSFIDIFCEKILNDNQDNLENLFNYLIFTPNQRIIRNLQNGFLRVSQAKSLILPKMISLSDTQYIIANNSLLFNDTYKKEFADILKPTISKRERTFILAKLIKKMDAKLGFSQALAWAEDLGNLIDKAYWEDIDFNNLENIVESGLAIHWQEILKFLHIATEFWPQIIKEKQMIDLALQQKLTLQLQTKIFKENPPKEHVIALNLLSFNKDNINFLKTINTLPKSDIYFYGIDKNITEDTFNNLEYTHPQKIISNILNQLDVKKETITDIVAISPQENIIHRIFDNTIYKNAESKDIKNFSSKFSIIKAKNEEEEAKTIALAMREVLETQGKTAGLITNNQNLITRVRSELLRYDIEIDDYLGNSLYNSLQAKFFLLVGNIIMQGFEPEDFLALLKHPFCLMNLSRKKVLENAKNLDFYLFRNLLEHKTILAYKNEIKNMEYLNSKIKSSLLAFLDHIEVSFPEIFITSALSQNYKKINFQETLINHIKIAEQLTTNKENTKSDLWTEQEGKELSLLLAKLLEESISIEEVSINEYMDIIKKSILDINIRTIYNKHPRLYIYGELQNNLIQHDLLIVANMNEGTMPFLTPPNPWMNESMMNKLGFLPSESQIGLKANVFSQTLGANEVILVRSEKEQGKLTTPSRWLLQLETFLDYYKSSEINKKQYLYEIQQKVDIPQDFTPLILDNVSFNPPIAVRPTKISATQLESLIKNPYLFFIERILKIKPLDRINPIPNKRDYGNALHQALENFFINLNTFKTLPKEHLYLELINLTEARFKTFLQSPTFRLFKMPIIKKGIYELLNTENLEEIDKSYTELFGSIPISVGDFTIELSGKADRIDILNNSTINIFDYKTTASVKIEEYWQQLLILSLILYHQGFEEITHKPLYINTSYIFFPNKFGDSLQKKDNGIPNIIEYLPEFIVKIENLLTKYYVAEIPYEFNLEDKKVYEEYKHFIRFDEWNTNFTNTEGSEEN